MLQELTDSPIPKLITICLASPVARSKSLAAPIKNQESKTGLLFSRAIFNAVLLNRAIQVQHSLFIIDKNSCVTPVLFQLLQFTKRQTLMVAQHL